MTGVTILTAPSEAGKPPSKLTVDDAEIRYSILPMLVGNSELTFDVHAFGGEVTGSFGQHGKDKSVDVAIDAIDLGKMQPLSALIGVPIEGKLTGVVRLSMPEGKASKGSGQLSLESTGTAVGDGKAKLKGAVALPRLDIGTVTIGADAKDGVMKITKYTAGGKDLDLQGDGRITLREQFTDSLGDMQVRFRINDAYRSKNDLTKSLFGVPGSNAPALFELADPKIKQSKRTDGSYAWTVRGPLSKLEFVPAAR
jgi:type II secretion system protein N